VLWATTTLGMMNERAAIATNVVNERWGTFIEDSLTEVPAWMEIPKSGILLSHRIMRNVKKTLIEYA
jgi:hypothetical protein